MIYTSPGFFSKACRLRAMINKKLKGLENSSPHDCYLYTTEKSLVKAIAAGTHLLNSFSWSQFNQLKT